MFEELWLTVFFPDPLVFSIWFCHYCSALSKTIDLSPHNGLNEYVSFLAMFLEYDAI